MPPTMRTLTYLLGLTRALAGDIGEFTEAHLRDAFDPIAAEVLGKLAEEPQETDGGALYGRPAVGPRATSRHHLPGENFAVNFRGGM